MEQNFEQKKKSFDGTDKGAAGGSPGILYHLENQMTESGRKLREQVLDNASDKARQFFNNGNYDPLRKVDAATLNEDEWHAYRKTYLGASEAAVVMGYSPYSSTVDLYHEKRGDLPVIEPSPKDAAEKELIFLWGHIAEQYLRAYVKTIPEFSGCEVIVETEIFGWEKAPYLACNLDAILKWPDGRYSLLEFKAPGEFVANEYKDNNIPVQYAAQCQQQMSLLNIDDAYLIAMFSRDKVTVSHLLRDMDEGMEIINAMENAWTEISAGIPPQLKAGTPKVMGASANRWRPFSKKGKTTEIAATYAQALEEAYAAAQEYKEYSEMAKAANDRKMAALAPILLSMGENSSGHFASAAAEYKISCTDTAGAETLTSDALKCIRQQNPQLYQMLSPYLSTKAATRRVKLSKTIK